MHFRYVIPTLLFLSASSVHGNVVSERSVVNGQCTGSGGAPGVCIATAKCTSGGGKFISNACPGTPNDIKCCTKTSCSSGGNCRWNSQCASGKTLTGLCPGPAAFKCCVPGGGTTPAPPPPTSGGGKYPAPAIPGVGACRAPAVSGAKKVVAGNPGGVRQIYCTRDCSCPGTSDHCCGMAIDFMCSSGGGVRTESGRSIAEWVVNNRASLGLKYVIWGQKIWTPGQDAVKPWTQWRGMENRGSITANHWDHVHVSFK